MQNSNSDNFGPLAVIFNSVGKLSVNKKVCISSDGGSEVGIDLRSKTIVSELGFSMRATAEVFR